MSATITINGISTLASSPVQWALRSGVKPVIMEYDMSIGNFKNLMNSFSSLNTVTLQINFGGNKTLAVNNLYYIGNSVGANPYIRKVIIADRRWLWNRHAIRRNYNIRRHVGIQRLTAIDVEELQETAPEVIYARYSVKATSTGNVTKWTAREIIEDIIKELVDYEKDYNSGARDSTFRGNFKREIPVENLRIDDSGSSALNKVLSLVGGSDVFIDYNGNIIIYDKTSSTEQQAEFKIANDMFSGITPRLVNFGNVDRIDKSFLRPGEVRVMFHREIELRFDATETDVTVATPTGEDTRRNMDNVLSLPDWTLDTDVQGTWVEIVSTLALWNALSKPAGVVAEFTMKYLRKAFVPFIDFWSPFLLNGVIDPGLNRDWAARVASVMLHWRKTFRINKNWIDRIVSLKAYRVATIDRATGQRSPAIAYANYCQLYTERSFYDDTNRSTPNGQPPSYVTNIEAGLAIINGIISNIADTNKPAPARVSVIDEDQGILGLDFLGDVHRLRENTIPGIIGVNGSTGVEGILTSDISRANVNNIAFDAIGSSRSVGSDNIPEIVDGVSGREHITTIITTVIAASPNDNRQYHIVVIKPNELEGIPVSKGPPVEIIVGPSVETARVRWLDSRKEDIESLFGIGLEEEDPIALSRKVDDLVINKQSTGSGKEVFGSLDEIARAVAYKVYLPLIDRIAGDGAINMQTNMEPRGYIDEISQEVNPDGVAVTRISSPVEVPELDLFALLPENSRNAIMKIAGVGK